MRLVITFDGDEMNLHVPQSLEAEIELYVASRCANHIVSSQSNSPVNGPVQDALVGIYMLTKHWDDGTITMVKKNIVYKIYKDTEISDNIIQDMLSRAKEYYPEYIIDNGKLLDITDKIPGNLFVSILFPPNLCYSKTIELESGESKDVQIEDGILLPNSAHLCKKTVGAKSNSIVHVLWKRSPELALKFISNLQQVTDRWLSFHGFSMSIADCYADCSTDVAKVLLETRAKVDTLLSNPPENKNANQIEREVMNILNGAMATGPRLAKGSMAKGDRNALNIMRNSGAKGSLINLTQIVANVGQQNIKGARMPPQLSHESRCLPSFLKGDKSPDARGFVEHNYVQGLTPQEAFFHAGAGRDGVISTALKSVTGETEIVILQGNRGTKVNIGDWIDDLLLKNQKNVQIFTEREMELYEISHLKIKIPTTDEKGNVTWGLIKNITRHDPGKVLYYITTRSGRSVTVTESKALLIWDETSKSFLPKDTPSVKIGDFAPTTATFITDIHNYIEKNDVVLDPIISIKIVEISDYLLQYPKYHGKVYDLTVPSTLNFGLANGLHVVDTADTGYLQKKLGRKLEDAKVWFDGSVRNANGSIISFLYGDDGMEAKKLVPVKGLKSPFFVNPYILARQLNSDAKREKLLRPDDKIRHLTNGEIELVASLIGDGYIETPVTVLALSNTRSALKNILKNVELYECKIADFFVEIKSNYDNSRAPYGYAAGLVSTSSIGEPNSQMTMNSFHTTGVGDKNETVGVARFRELINVTKSAKQKNTGCTIYFNDEDLINKAKLVDQLQKQNSSEIKEINELRVKDLKKELLIELEGRKLLLEEKYVHQFLSDYQIKYLPQDGDIPANSPINLMTYEEYEESWWVTLSKNLTENYDNLEPVSWVINLEFDIEKLFKARIDLEDIAYAIEDNSCNTLTCIISPNIIGRIEVYADVDSLKFRLESKLKIPENKGVMTYENSDYYLIRDPVIHFIKNTLISGVKDVRKAYTKEDLSTHEWIIETDGADFLKVLTSSENIDKVRTLVNDIHEIMITLGIEAARRFLFEEITKVLSYDGMYIDHRHISLLVDVMTFNGNLTAASRDGISREDVGPNAKIMFEKSVDNAMISCAFGEVDTMKSLASAVMYGKVALTGPKLTEICVKNNVNKQPPLKNKVNKTLPIK